MIRDLPIIDFNGTPFQIDIGQAEFRQVENPLNRIDFDELYETPNGFKMHYDPVTKSAFRGSEGEFTGRDDIEIVKLPPLEEMDPEGFKMMVGKWMDDNPRLTVAIQKIPVVTNSGETKTIGELIAAKKEQLRKPLLEKKRHSLKNGLRQ